MQTRCTNIQTRGTQEHTDTMCMCGWVCVVELTWHWGEDVGAVSQVVGVVELYSAVLIHRPDNDCRQTHETYATSFITQLVST